MDDAEGSGRSTLRVFAVAALALVGLAFSATPIAERADGILLDAQWSLLRKFDPRPGHDDIIIVGVDDASARNLQVIAGIWNEPLGRALALISAAKPRAIGLDVPLPDRSLDTLRPGLDRALLAGIMAARQNGPFVAVISIDPRTRAAKPIYAPYLAVLQDDRLGLSLLAREADGVTRRFSLLVPTEDGGFPTLAGRLCRALSRDCGDGLIHFALGPPLRYVPLHQVVENHDPQFFDRLFRGRIVLIGETQRYSDRVSVPVNLAAWEPPGETSPGVVVHAQSLRTALENAAPAETAKPVTLMLVTLGALVVLMRRAPLALATALLGATALFTASLFALRAGTFVPIAAALLTIAVAWIVGAAHGAWRTSQRRMALREDFGGAVSAAAMKEMLAGRISVTRAETRDVAFVCAGVAGPEGIASGDAKEALATLGRIHEALAAPVQRHGGRVDGYRGDGISAVFGAPQPLPDAARAAWAASREMLEGMDRLNAERARQGKPPVDVRLGAAFGKAAAGYVAASKRHRYAVVGDGAAAASRLQRAAASRGYRALVDAALQEKLGEGAGLEASQAADPETGTGPAWGWRG
jgi:adenylate cyclase